MNRSSISKKRIVFIILAIMLMAGIFWFSSRNADISTEDSHSVGYLIGKIFIRDFESKGAEYQQKFVSDADFYVRKTAHFLEFALLGILLFFATGSYKYDKRWIIAFILTALYAVSDEIHQIFVPGRAGMILDVIWDSFGAFCGIMLIRLICKLLGNKSNKNDNKSSLKQ